MSVAATRTSRPLVRVAAWLVTGGALLPLVYLALLTVADGWQAPRLLPDGLRFDRLRNVLSDSTGLLRSLLLSMFIALLVAAASTALGLITSRQLSHARHLRLWLLLAYLPFAISPVVLATCLLFVFIKVHLSGTLLGVILAQIMLAYGFATILLLGLWNSHKQGLEQVARTLGANPRQVWLRVLIPASLPLLRICFFQTFLISWAQYGLTLLIGSGKVRTLPLRVFEYALEADPAYAAVAGLLLIVPPLALLWIERRIVFKVV
jgi:putative spermidine/putrescine transport system permease protein